MSDIRKLVATRGILKGIITRIGTYVKKPENAKDQHEIQTRYEKLIETYNQLEEIQNQIDFLSDSESETDERERNEDIFYNLSAHCKKLLTSSESLLNSTQNSLVLDGSTDVNIKLPQINLPIFSGEYDNWLVFSDSFKALIANNTNLSNVQKLYYLKSSLKGEALNVILSLEVTSDNYAIAWKMLEDRYQNNKLILHAHLKKIFELTPIIKNNHHHLRKFLDVFLINFRSLKGLKQPVEHWDTLLIYLICSKLNLELRSEWEGLNIDSPKLENLIDFLTTKCQLLETLDNKNKKESTTFKGLSHVTSRTVETKKCNFCKGFHSIYYCRNFLKLNPQQRYDEIKKLRLCTNCFKSNHFANQCTSGECKICHKKHNTLLHIRQNQTPPASSNSSQNNNTQIPSSSNLTSSQEQSHVDIALTNHCNFPLHSQTLLQTAVINILDAKGTPITCRALLDSGSQVNFIRKSLFDKLNLPASKINIPVSGINNSKTNINSCAQIQIQSIYNSFQSNLSFLIIDVITSNIPLMSFKKDSISIPKNLTLADPDFNISRQIDILLGASVFFDLLCVGQIKLQDNTILQKTKLGWIISGSLILSNNLQIQSFHTSVQNEFPLKKFWEIEECIITRKASKSLEETEVENHFLSTFKLDSSGRFVVKFPFKSNYKQLGNNLENATKRFISLEKRLSKNENIKAQYHDFIKEYIQLNHMEKINPKHDSHDLIKYYLPHHCVIKDSLTTKLRVVFDGSAKSETGLSLNDILHVGPVIQDDLFSILVRFRQHNYVITSDVEKMYRQILLDKEHQTCQRILWRFNDQSEIDHYQLKTVTYGTASASYLATRCLQETTSAFTTTFPVACNSILKDFYVDDLITGSNDLAATIKLKNDISHILNNYGFKLRKWNSNSSEIKFANSESELDPNYVINDTKETKILGIVWNSDLDKFIYSVKEDEFNSKIVTKRTILSLISKLFDPLGLIGPVILKAKIIIQSLWKLNLDWDESVPIELFTQWNNYKKDMLLLKQLEIPRHALLCNAIDIQLHGFCDASQNAYGAAIYLRSTDSQGNISVNLLCAKSKVAPVKIISIPKLELCGALLLSKLIHKIQNTLTLSISDRFYWCDSTITLSWINGQPYNWKTFVANRVTEIQELTQIKNWNYVSSEKNPADIISRTSKVPELINSRLWWHGPDFLMLDSKLFFNKNFICPENIPEQKSLVSQESNLPEDIIFYKFSSYFLTLRVMAYVLRFIHNSQNKNSRRVGLPTNDEILIAKKILIKLAQRQSFLSDYLSLLKHNSVSKGSKLLSLSPFLDNDNLIRVGGRLSNAKQLKYDQIHPYILPSNHLLTKLIIRHAHAVNLHAGSQFLLAFIRQEFWILNGKNTIKGVLRNCTICFRFKPKSIFPQMGNLPVNRITPSIPFSNCGIDYAGPLFIKNSIMRNKTFLKAYLCIFVCFATKAVHIEIAIDLTSEEFLNALKRFTSRRGIPKNIYSDNATNFVGANNMLKTVNCNSFQHFLQIHNINWHFIPARSPHFGGLWESAVKSAKSHLIRTVGDQKLTYHDLNTLVNQIEAILNSRPLFPCSNDPNDLIPLTPGHFLIGQPLTAIPQDNITSIPQNKLKHFYLLQQIIQSFWKRWSIEYLNNLQQRYKWQSKPDADIRPGLLVLLKEENSAPLHWRLGRILETHPGNDGIIRTVSIKTNSGIIKRAIHRICIFPSH